MAIENYRKKLEKFLLKQEEKKEKEKLRKRKKKAKKKKSKTIIAEPKQITKRKKVGRPRKPGPKKKRIRKKIVKTYKERPVCDFKIVSVLNGKQNGYIAQFQTYADAYAKLMSLENANNTVVFPRKFINSGNIAPLKDEYLLLEKNRQGDKEDGMVRNEFGKFIRQKITNSSKWIVRDKIIRKVEETFWVYGFDPRLDRKDFTWIYNNLVIGAIENSYDVIRILIYKNKLIIRYDDKPMSLVMCKNISDAIRMYNAISERVEKLKTKQIVCVGSYNTLSEARRTLEAEIMDLTGWSKMKIQRSSN
jgi:hypothetical protein